MRFVFISFALSAILGCRPSPHQPRGAQIGQSTAPLPPDPNVPPAEDDAGARDLSVPITAPPAAGDVGTPTSPGPTSPTTGDAPAPGPTPGGTPGTQQPPPPADAGVWSPPPDAP